MKREDLIKYHQMPIKDLEQEVFKRQRKLAEMHLAIGTGKQKNTSLMKLTRQDLARLKTLIREREMGVLIEKKAITPQKAQQIIKKEKKASKKTVKEVVKA